MIYWILFVVLILSGILKIIFIKFGIEKSTIVSITELSKCEKSDLLNADFQKQLTEICTDLSYGSIEFDLFLGKVERLNYCKSFNGELLKKKMGAL
jgi:hypothetical protein